jgi:hypothetical protein
LEQRGRGVVFDDGVYSQQRPEVVAMAPGAIPVNNATSAIDGFTRWFPRVRRVNLSNKINRNVEK